MVRLRRPAPKFLALRSPQIESIPRSRLWLDIVGYLACLPTAG
jgi:hypothetical protein